MTISEEYKSFLWLPNKTGSNNASKIFSKLGFKTYKKTEFEYELSEFSANHNYVYPLNHKDYNFICTARNPFTRILSSYKFNRKDSSSWNPEDFREYFFRKFNASILQNVLYPFKERTPDYFIRIENLIEDYRKIDFIVNSDLYKSGYIEEVCQKKINYTDNLSNPKEYFTEDIIDFIYTNGQRYFDLLNYTYPY